MNAFEYAPLARRTLKEMPFRGHMVHMALGAAGELGELLDAIKKVLAYGKPMDIVNLTEEVGDTLWYIANLLPELVVDASYMQRSLDRGYTKGTQAALQLPDEFALGEALLAINKAVAGICADLPRMNPAEAIGTSHTVQVIELLAGNVGVICGLVGIDPAHAMERNIAKLAARYGDKFSEFAALNRDTDAERRVLEFPSAGKEF